MPQTDVLVSGALPELFVRSVSLKVLLTIFLYFLHEIDFFAFQL